MHACCLARRVDEQDASKKCITALLVWSERHFRPSRWMIGRHTFHPSSPPSMVVGYQYSTRPCYHTYEFNREGNRLFTKRSFVHRRRKEALFWKRVCSYERVCVCRCIWKNASSQSAFFVKMLNRLVVVVGSHLVAAPLNWTELNWPNQTTLAALYTTRRIGVRQRPRRPKKRGRNRVFAFKVPRLSRWSIRMPLLACSKYLRAAPPLNAVSYLWVHFNAVFFYYFGRYRGGPFFGE